MLIKQLLHLSQYRTGTSQEKIQWFLMATSTGGSGAVCRIHERAKKKNPSRSDPIPINQRRINTLQWGLQWKFSHTSAIWPIFNSTMVVVLDTTPTALPVSLNTHFGACSSTMDVLTVTRAVKLLLMDLVAKDKGHMVTRQCQEQRMHPIDP